MSDDLINAALPYWEAEAEIARRFFAGNPSRDDHIFWLKAQIWKELHPVDGYFSGIHRELNNLAEMFPRVDVDIDRHHFGFLMKQILEEYTHYVLFADILEFLTGMPVKQTEMSQLAEEKKLGDIRRGYSGSGSPIDRAAVLFTEGGGARLFREGAKVHGGKLEEMIAAAMRTIYDDERDHFREAAKEAQAVLAAPGDFERMRGAIVDVSRQRVAMRREMFRNAMSPAEVDAFIAHIEAEIAAGTFQIPA
jgi:hypothetical protein